MFRFRADAFRLALCLLVLLAALPAGARTLLIGATVDPPLKWPEAGTARGIDVEILSAILPEIGVTDWEFRFYDSGQRLQEEGRTGKVDMLASFSRNPEREAYLAYPTESHISLSWRFMVRAEDAGRIRYDSYDDLKGLAVGATRGVSYTDAFWKAGLDLRVITTEEPHLPMLLAGRIDVVPMVDLKARYLAKQAGVTERIALLPKALRTADYFHVWSRASTYPDRDRLLRDFDQALQRMKADGRLKAIIERYAP